MYNLEIFAKQKFEITPEQFIVLSMLSEDIPLHQNKLCELLCKNKANMASILSILEKKELIEKNLKLKLKNRL